MIGRAGLMPRVSAVVVLALVMLSGAGVWGGGALQAEVRVQTDHAGGNGVIEAMEPGLIRLRPDLRDTRPDWFYWNIRVTGAEGTTVRFQCPADVFGPLGPAISRDDGMTWNWLGREAVRENGFAVDFASNEKGVRLAFCIPHTGADLERFLHERRDQGGLRVETLCRSRGGRPVPRLRVGAVDGEPRHRVLLVARHHACESMASFTLEGVIDEILGESPEGRWLRSEVEFLIVPFMDRDGVEAGDQGKLRQPHDHWEDYAPPGIYPETRALREYVPGWAGDRLRLALDVHCPSRLDQELYFAATGKGEVHQKLARLAVDLEQLPGREVPFQKDSTLAFGKGWNTPAYYGPRVCFMNWAEGLAGSPAAGTLEVPYARTGETVMTPDVARRLGADLARAIQRFLRP